MKIGDAVFYFDELANGHISRVTQVHGTEEKPTVNLQYCGDGSDIFKCLTRQDDTSLKDIIVQISELEEDLKKAEAEKDLKKDEAEKKEALQFEIKEKLESLRVTQSEIETKISRAKTVEIKEVTSVVHKDNVSAVAFKPQSEAEKKEGKKPVPWNMKINCYKVRGT